MVPTKKRVAMLVHAMCRLSSSAKLLVFHVDIGGLTWENHQFSRIAFLRKCHLQLVRSYMVSAYSSHQNKNWRTHVWSHQSTFQGWRTYTCVDIRCNIPFANSKMSILLDRILFCFILISKFIFVCS